MEYKQNKGNMSEAKPPGIVRSERHGSADNTAVAAVQSVEKCAPALVGKKQKDLTAKHERPNEEPKSAAVKQGAKVLGEVPVWGCKMSCNASQATLLLSCQQRSMPLMPSLSHVLALRRAKVLPMHCCTKHCA